MAADRVNPTYNYPGRMASVMRFKDTALAMFLFRSEQIDYHDLDAQKRILADAFAGMASGCFRSFWRPRRRIPSSASNPPVRSICRAGGRVVLVGDAAHAASGLSGRGTSLALTGAWFLAEELDSAGTDLASAFARYEERQRPYATAGQASVGAGARSRRSGDTGRDRHATPGSARS